MPQPSSYFLPPTFWQTQSAPMPIPTPNPGPISVPPPITSVSSQSSAKHQRGSSPNGSQTDEEAILDDFWNWKFRSTNRPEKKQLYANARALIEKELWTISDLKEMSDSSSEIYQHAMRQGIPHGLARTLHNELHDLKNIWRTQYRPGRQILDLHAARQDPSGN